jgi:hypothetical protein
MTCPQCGCDMSDLARACPRCGADPRQACAPVVEPPAVPQRRGARVVFWIAAGVMSLGLLLCAGYFASVGFAVVRGVSEERQSPDRNSRVRGSDGVRKAEGVRTINEASAVYELDTGTNPASVEDLAAEAGPPGYKGPYLWTIPVDPFSGSTYQLSDGKVVGPADVTTFLE